MFKEKDLMEMQREVKEPLPKITWPDIMRRTKEEIEQLVEALRQANTAGWVCDSVQFCEGWQKSYKQIKDGLDYFDYQTEGKAFRGYKFIVCPWCSRALDWVNWERLK